MRTPADLDAHLATAAFVEDPFPTYEALRRTAPVSYSETLGGWLVARHADVRGALHDHARLSSFGWELRHLERLDPAVRAEVPELFAHFRTRGLIYADPPEHTRLRRLVQSAFTPKTVAALGPHIAGIVDELLEAAPSDGFDVVRDLAYPLPATVIAELLGVPREDRDRFKGWSSQLTTFFGSADPQPERARVANASLTEFRAYLRDLLEERGARPRDDVLSRLATTGAGEDALALGEILNTCVIFLVAGHETTTNLIGNATLALSRRPHELGAVRGEPGRLPLVLEETLRHDGPIQRVRRMVVEDCELGGQRLAAGDAVHLLIGAANRDPGVFAEPDRFWPDRPKAPHIAFGLGVHFCIGATLARAEATVALERLVDRFPALATAPGWQPEHQPSLTIRGVRELPLAR